MKSGIWQFLWLDLVKINAYTFLFQNIPYWRPAVISVFVPRLFEEKGRDTVFGFAWRVVRGVWRVVRGSEFLVGTLTP